LFDDYCKYIFDPGGTKLQLLWALKNPLDLRTNPLQEGGDDESTPRPNPWPTCTSRPKPNQRPNNKMMHVGALEYTLILGQLFRSYFENKLQNY